MVFQCAYIKERTSYNKIASLLRDFGVNGIVYVLTIYFWFTELAAMVYGKGAEENWVVWALLVN